MQDAPLVYVLILNWNGWKDTIECVESCLKLVYSNYHILILDNSSADNSEEILRKKFPNIEIIQTGANLGFAGGNNIGIKHALKKGAQYIWLLNNDTVVDQLALTELVRAAKSDKKVGALGSKIYYFDQPNIIWSVGGIIDNRTGEARSIGFLEEDKGQYDQERVVDYATGCSLLIKKSAIESVGLLDEKFFIYYEETDWCWRARKNAFVIYYAPFSKIWHKISRSTGQGSQRTRYYVYRNSLLFMFKNNIFQLPISIFHRLQQIRYLNQHRRYDDAEIAILALLDFLLFKFGSLQPLQLRSQQFKCLFYVIKKIFVIVSRCFER